jgi:hypothetical protein
MHAMMHGIAAQYLHGARVCVIPRPENDFRPYALRHRSLVAVSALLILAKAVALGTLGLMPLPAELSTITTARIIQLTNAERAKAGLGELTISDALSRAAVHKAQDMLDHDYFAHISPAGVTPWFWISKENYSYRLAGENLAIDFTEAEDVAAAWMASPSHRDNILRADYAETGVGVLTGEFEGATSTVVVHMFGLPAAAAVLSQNRLPAAAGEPAVLAASPPAVPAATAVPETPTVTVPASAAVQNTLGVTIVGEADTIVSLLVNSQPRADITLPPSGTLEYSLTLDGLPDGELIIRAQARDGLGRASALSEPNVVTKDTRGPEISDGAVTLIVSPATDEPAALLRLAGEDVASLTITTGGTELAFVPTDAIVIPLSATAAHLAFADAHGNISDVPEQILLPSFYAEPDVSYLNSPARFSRVIRRLTIGTLLALLILLTMAVAIRIQIQHPRMIMHTIFVLALATALLLI